MQTVMWSQNLQSTVRDLKKQTDDATLRNISQNEHLSVQHAFDKTSSNNAKFMGEWL